VNSTGSNLLHDESETADPQTMYFQLFCGCGWLTPAGCKDSFKTNLVSKSLNSLEGIAHSGNLKMKRPSLKIIISSDLPQNQPDIRTTICSSFSVPFPPMPMSFQA